MDRYTYKKSWIKKGAIAGGGLIVIVLLLIFALIGPENNRMQEARAGLTESRKYLSDLNLLVQNIIEYRAKFEEAEGISEEFADYILTPGLSPEDLNTYIAEAASAGGLRLEQINHVENVHEYKYLKQLSSMSFRASFNDSLQFLKEIYTAENFIGLGNMTFRSAWDRNAHETEIFVFNIPDINTEAVTADELAVGTDALLNMPAASLEVIENILELTEFKEINIDIDKDPLYYRDTLYEERVIVRRPPRLHLGGIVWDESSPVAIIDGELRSIGDVVRGARVTRIERDFVIMEWNERQIRLQID